MFVSLLAGAISIATVFLFGSIGEILTEKAGHLNLGIPGVMCLGGIGACLGANFAVAANFPIALIWLFTAVCSMIFAGLMGLLYGFLTITMRCNQNATGLVLTTFGAGVLGFWGTMMAKEQITFYKASDYFTRPFFGNVGDDWFSQIFLSHSMLFYYAIFITIILAIVLSKTKVGLNLRAVGENPAAADAAGINVLKYKYVACILGSAISGLGGAFYLLVRTRGSIEYTIDALGWLAVALVIFSLWKPALSIIGSIIFGFLYLFPYYIEGISFATMELLKMIPYAVTAITLIVISFFGRKETQPPAALGVPYFREER